ncbi:HEAT repeat protein [Dictyocaulus viviparus]|uniref:HEAT repeat protein n=1 Tax=Dictyocaulus viviparus TaxID=29172 RepID=A0A0D8YAR8_DICVI|nr:HEAT repeat protein [Dictyocaulus viviparus]
MVAQVHCLGVFLITDLISSLLDCSTTYPNCEQVKNEVFVPKNFRHIQLSASCKAFVLNVIDSVVSDTKVICELDEQLVLLLINLATQEMTMTSKIHRRYLLSCCFQDTDADWAESAKNILVTVAKDAGLVKHVLDAVLQKFPPGLTISPHRYIVLTMATIAEHNRTSAWTRAICAFCECIRECETEKPAEPDGQELDSTNVSSTNVEKGNNHFVIFSRVTYEDQAKIIYEVVFQWMYSKDPKTRAEAAECVGELCLMIPAEKLVEDLKKLVSTILGLYRKAYTEHYTITKALCRFLEATCANDACPLEPYVEDILNALFPNACLDPDDSSATLNTLVIKNHSEAFRCFHVAASRFADKIVYYLLHKIQSVVDIQKLGAINVLRHLLNSSGQYMEDKRSLLMMGLRKLLAAENNTSIKVNVHIISMEISRALTEDDSHKVKRATVQLCIALSDHAYVDSEGGEHVIAFLVRNLVQPAEHEQQARRLELDVAGSNQLRTQCGQALNIISSTCVCANKLLWPYLLEFICVERYFPVMGEICKCLRTLITMERKEGRELDFESGFDNARVAGNHAVFARLFICLCNAPLNGLLANRARESYGLMRQLSAWFHPAVSDVMEKWSDRMNIFMDEMCSTSLPSPSREYSPAVELRGRKIARWHETCLEMLSSCISAVLDGEWRISLAAVMGKQLDLYKDYPDEKAFLLRSLGTALSKITLKSFVVDHLMLMFKSAQHTVPTERQGCARGIGACAAFHTDLVLVELENVSKWEHAKKSSGFFGFIKEAMPIRQYTDTEMVLLRATLMLSYGYVVQCCPIDTITQRLQQTIITFLRHYFVNSKQETVVREAMLETMRLIAISVHPSRLHSDYRFEARNELIGYIKDYVQCETPEILSSSLRLLAAKAAGALVRLEPPLSDDDIWDLGRILTQYILPMCREKSGLKTATTIFPSFVNLVICFIYKVDDDESATIMDATVAQYSNALEAIVEMRPTVGTLTLILKVCRALSLVSNCVASDFGPLSSLLARLSPRLVDSLAFVRYQSLAAIHYAFRLANAYKVIEARLPQCQMQTYLSALFEMMTDRQSQVSSAAAQLLTYILKCRGATLILEADTLVSTMLARLSEVHSCVQTYTDLLAALVAFAMHQQTILCDVMLRQPLPYSIQLLDAWKCVSCDRSLFASTLDYLLELMTNALDQPYDVVDTGGGTSLKVVHVEPCQYAAAITEVVKNGEPECSLNERVPMLLASLFHMISSVSDTQWPVVVKENKNGNKQPLIITPELRRSAEKPAGLAVAALKTLLSRTQSSAIIEDMNQARGWTECLDRELFVGALTVLVRSIAEHRSDWIDPFTRRVMEKSCNTREPIRFTAVIVSSALIRKSPDSNDHFNEDLLISCIRLLENSLTDQSLRIRKLCVRGLGELSECPSETVSERFASMAVEAAMGGLDDLGDKNDAVGISGFEVAMESIIALNKLVSRIKDDQLLSILRQVLLKIRPCFEKEYPALRAASFRLFGELAIRVGSDNDELMTHLHANIIAILLHLNDESEDVRKACSILLYQVHPLLGVGTFSSIVEQEMDRGRLPETYSSVQRDLGNVLALSFPDRVNQYTLTCTNYFKCSNARMRANAALLTGNMLSVLTPQLRAIISKDLVFSSLVLLLKDPEDVIVRIAAVKAIGNLHDFS